MLSTNRKVSLQFPTSICLPTLPVSTSSARYATLHSAPHDINLPLLTSLSSTNRTNSPSSAASPPPKTPRSARSSCIRQVGPLLKQSCRCRKELTRESTDFTDLSVSSATYRVVVAAHDHRSAQRTPGQARRRRGFRRRGRSGETGQGCEPLEWACCVPAGLTKRMGGGRCGAKKKNTHPGCRLAYLALPGTNYSVYTTSISNRTSYQPGTNLAMILSLVVVQLQKRCLGR